MNDITITPRLEQEIISFTQNTGWATAAKDLVELLDLYITLLQSIGQSPDPRLRFRNLFDLMNLLEAAAQEMAVSV